MRIQYEFRDVVLAALLLSCLAKAATGQQSPQQLDVPTLSPAVHSALYPEVMCGRSLVPQWDRGYILHLEIDKDPAVVTMYDRDGKKVLEARLEPPDAAKVSLSAAASTHAGGILAIGGGVMTDGSIQGFIAKTDLARGAQFNRYTLADSHRIRFARRADGSVWTLGYALDYRDSPDADKNVVRHYSLEKGLLERLVVLDSIAKSSDAILNASSPEKSFLRCGKDRVSVFFGSPAEYIEVDASNGNLRAGMSPFPNRRRKSEWICRDEGGRIFVSLRGFSEPDNIVTHGLYELKAKTGISVANLIPVSGTLTAHERNGLLPDETFDRLWGTDGDELLVQDMETVGVFRGQGSRISVNSRLVAYSEM